MRRSNHGSLPWGATVLCALVACNQAELAPPQGPNSELTSELKRLQAGVEDAESRIAASERTAAERCELSVGDCEYDVKDGRRNIVFGRSIQSCTASSSAAERRRCEDDVIVAAGRGEELLQWYRGALWCREQMTSCLAEQATSANQELLRQEYLRRDAHAAGAEVVAQAALELETARDRTAYLRQLLPPKLAGQCAADAPGDDCQVRVEAARTEYEDYLHAGSGGFDPDEAARKLARTSDVERECYAKEQSCLEREAFYVGESDATASLLRNVYDELASRRRQIARVGTERAAECTERVNPTLDATVAELARQYAKSQSTPLRLQLHKSHLKRLKAQVRCLQGLR